MTKRRKNHSTDSLARRQFELHIALGGRFRKFVLTVMFNLSKCRVLFEFPLVGGFIRSIADLSKAYEVEEEFGLLRELESYSSTIKTRPGNSMDPSPCFREIYDYIIIGSGPGAATAASKLSPNLRVLILEKGGYPQTPHSLHHTLTHVVNDFNKAGQEIILAKGFPQFTQGSTFGGGSEVNSGLYHPLPEVKREAFSFAFGISENKWIEEEKLIRDLLKIELTAVNVENSVIYRGAKFLDLPWAVIPRWRKYSNDGTFVHFGMSEVVWKDFLKRENVKLSLETEAIRIRYNSPKSVKVLTQNSSKEVIEFEGRNVIVAAGTIETPRLLASSRLIGWTDTRFQWHQMYRTIVDTDESDLGATDIDPIQAWTNDYSLKFGSAVSTPGLLSFGLGRKISYEETKRLRSYYVSIVSSGRGGLIPKTSIPWYRASDSDKRLSREGRLLLTQLIEGSGARFAAPSTPVSQKASTVHIFGSLPISSSIFENGSCQLRKYSNIFICDGSILPYGPGVNPQGVIMTAVHSMFNPID